MRLSGPDINREDIRPKPLPPRHAAFKGQVSRIVLEILRTSTGPVFTPDLARHIMEERSLNTSDKRLVLIIQKRVGACLRHLRSAGIVHSEQDRGKRASWQH